MSYYYDDDYDDYYYGHRYYRRRYVPDYTNIKNVTEWMKKYMCYGLGLGKVCEFLKNQETKTGDMIAGMYRRAISAERESAGAKYGGGSYSQKEAFISQLIDLCVNWRKMHATKEKLPDLEKRIEEINKSNMKEKNKKKKINGLINTVCYEYDSPDNVLKFTKENSDLYVASNIYYFELPGCEQISYHSNLHKASGTDKIHWDRKENSTLIKLNCAVSRRYGSQIKEAYSIPDADFEYFNSIVDTLDNECNNEYSHTAYEHMMSFVLEKLFIDKQSTIEKLRCSDLFKSILLTEMEETLSDVPDAQIYLKLFKAAQLTNVLTSTSHIWPECWIREVSNMTEDIKRYIDSIDYANAKYEEKENATVFKIEKIKVELVDFEEDVVDIADWNVKECSSSNLEKLIFDKFGPIYFADLYKRHIDAEAYRERLRQAALKEAEEKKTKERINKLKEIETYEFLTKSMLKECYMWTDTLINKFAGNPDQTKPNPMYKCAEPMQLFSKERILKIEKKPEFVAELKKSYKRRKLEWPYENDIIVHDIEKSES